MYLCSMSLSAKVPTSFTFSDLVDTLLILPLGIVGDPRVRRPDSWSFRPPIPSGSRCFLDLVILREGLDPDPRLQPVKVNKAEKKVNKKDGTWVSIYI